MRRPRPRELVIAAAAAFVAWILYEHVRLVSAQEPRLCHDSYTFLEIAAQPFSLDQLFYPKPIFTTIVYRWLGGDPGAIATAQSALSVVAWLALGGALGASLASTRARVAAAVVTAAFLLAPYRVGFASVVMSESIDDSLLALALALGLGVLALARWPASRRRTCVLAGTASALVLVLAAWLATRDTNAITCLAAIAMVVALVRPRRLWREQRWLTGLLALTAVVACGAIATTRVIPDAPLGLSLTEGWAPESTRRSVFPLVDDLQIRMLPDADARTRLVDAGLPWSTDLQPFVGEAAYSSFLGEPRYAPARTWMLEHGTSAYVGWLARHPLARLGEVIGNVWSLTGTRDLDDYMPKKGWRASGYGLPPTRLVRALTTSRWPLAALALALPALLWLARRHPLRPVAATLAASATLGLLAGYYGDGLEVARHCFGAGQQLVISVMVLALAAIDRAVTSREV